MCCNSFISEDRIGQITRSHLKNRILVQDRDRAEFQTRGIPLYVEDLKRGPNKDIGPKDIFEMASNSAAIGNDVEMGAGLMIIIYD